MSARTATVRAPPRTGLPLPTPGFDPLEVVGDPLEPDEQPARAAGAIAPSATAPPVTALRDRKLRRSISLRPFTCSPLTFGCSVRFRFGPMPLLRRRTTLSQPRRFRGARYRQVCPGSMVHNPPDSPT